MSSAAKLRNVRRGTVAVAAAAAVMTAFGPVAYASWDDAPQTAGTEAQAGNNGTIGVIDSDATVANNQGASLVSPAKDAQAIGGVRLVIPNRFVSGDVIELRLLDRAATAASDGTANSGPDYKLGFSADPKVAVSDVQNDDTVVTSDTDGLNTGGTAPLGNVTQNTETAPENPWVPVGAAGTNSATKPGVAPSFNVQRIQSKGAQGYDVIRLTHTGNPSTGDVDAKWVISLTDLKVDLGKSVTPGALRIVPFAMSKATSGVSYSNSDWFYGNRTPNTLVAAGDPSAVVTRQIGIYTVPAWVSPVSVSVANPDVVADGLPQNIGEVTIVESNPASLGNGTYTLTISGADISNPAAWATNLKMTVTNGGAGETATVTGATGIAGPNPAKVTFTLANVDDTKAATFKLSGLQLVTNTAGPIKYNLSGGTVDAFFAAAGTGGAIGGIPAEAALCANVPGGVVATNPPPVAVTRAYAATLGGANELGNGNYTFVGVPGATQVLKNAAGTTVATTADGLTFNMVAPYAGTIVVTALVPDTSTLAVTGRVLTHVNGAAADGTFSVVGGANQLHAGTYTLAVGPGGAGGNWLLKNGNGDTVAIGIGTGLLGVPVVFTLQAPFAGAFTLTPGSNNAADNITATDTITVAAAGETATITPPVVAITATESGATGLAAATQYFVVKDGANWYINNTNDTVTPLGTSADGLTFTMAAGGTITLSGAVPTGSTFTTNGAGPFNIPVVCVNQDDIVSPLAALTQFGTAKSNSDRIGGNDRYSTAAKIAAQWTNSEPGSGTDDAFGGGRARNVILVSGTSYPDALSASYMSSRLMAPILLTGANELPAQTIEALRDRFVEKVYIIGGTGAVSGGVEAALKDLNQYVPDSLPDPANPGQWLFRNPKPTGAKLQVQRLGGSDRYTTNQLANMYAAAWGGGLTVGKTVNKFGEAGKYTAILARGDAFPDALVGGILTAGYGGVGNTNANALPLVLTTPTEFAAPAKALFANLDIQHAILVGGTGALSDGVETAVKAAGATTNRLAGPDRYATAAEVNKFALKSAVGSATNPNPGLGFDVGAANDTVYLATGSNFPDALAAAPFVGWSTDTMALVIANEIPAPTKTFLNDYAAILDKATGLGLGGVVSAAVVQEANAIVSTK